MFEFAQWFLPILVSFHLGVEITLWSHCDFLSISHHGHSGDLIQRLWEILSLLGPTDSWCGSWRRRKESRKQERPEEDWVLQPLLMGQHNHWSRGSHWGGIGMLDTERNTEGQEMIRSRAVWNWASSGLSFWSLICSSSILPNKPRLNAPLSTAPTYTYEYIHEYTHSHTFYA